MELTPYYDKDITCLHCKEIFPTTKVRTKFIKVVETASDFQPIYKEVNGIYYNVHVCEHCGFSFTDDFSKYFAPGTQELIQQEITNKWVHRSYNGERTVFQAMETYKLALVCGTLKKEKNVAMAGLALRLGWLYRSLNNEGQEERFLTLARDYYAESYSTGDYSGTQMSEIRMLYMIAELSRRIGDIDEATRNFSRIIEKQSTATEPKIIDMAKEQWQLIREEKEKVHY